MKTRTLLAALALLATLTASAQTPTPAVTFRIGTVAPADSPYEQVINRMGQDWKRASNGTVDIKIFPGGTLGAENSMLSQVRLGSLQGVALSGVGLAAIAPGVSALQLPMVFDSYADLDRVRQVLEPRLEADLLTKGYVVLNWADVGWVHFFTKTRARTPDDIKKLKLFITKDDPASEKLYREMGFKPVPSSVTELLPSLQTGLLDAFDVPPLFALGNQSFALAKHMVCVPWAPVIGATIVDRKTWEKVPAALRPELLRIARQSSNDMRAKIRAADGEAIDAMKKRGLTVEMLTPAELESWRAIAKLANSKMRGGMVPADYFDDAVRLGKAPAVKAAKEPVVTGTWTGDWGLTTAARNPVSIDLKWDGKVLTGTLRPATPPSTAVALKNSRFTPSTGALHLEADAPNPRGGAAIRYVIDGTLVESGASDPCMPRSIAGAWSSGASKGDFMLTPK